MNADEIKGMLAEYLGDELNPEDRRHFEEYLNTDREFAAEVASLRCTRSLKVPVDGPTTAAPAVAARRPWWGPALRYAAVILLAFTTGFLVRGSSRQGTEIPPKIVVGPPQKQEALLEERE